MDGCYIEGQAPNRTAISSCNNARAVAFHPPKGLKEIYYARGVFGYALGGSVCPQRHPGYYFGGRLVKVFAIREFDAGGPMNNTV